MLSIPKPRAPALPLLLLTTTTLTLWPAPARADPNAPCYFPGGDLAPGYFPCIAYGAPVTSCCAPGWTCFSNSLCIATTESRSFPNISLGAVQRGACTAPKWNNEFCGSVCLSESPVSPSPRFLSPSPICPLPPVAPFPQPRKPQTRN